MSTTDLVIASLTPDEPYCHQTILGKLSHPLLQPENNLTTFHGVGGSFQLNS